MRRHQNGSYPKAQVSFMSESIGNFGNARAASEEVVTALQVSTG